MKILNEDDEDFDIQLLKEIKNGEMNYLETFYKNTEKEQFMIQSYDQKNTNKKILKTNLFLFILSKCSNLNIHKKENLIFYNTDFIEFLLNNEYIKPESHLQNLQNQYIDNLIYFIMNSKSINLDNKLNLFKLSFNYKSFKNVVLEKYWTSNQKNMTNSFISNLFYLHYHSVNQDTIDKFCIFLLERYKKEFLMYVDNVIEINKTNNQSRNMYNIYSHSNYIILINLLNFCIRYLKNNESDTFNFFDKTLYNKILQISINLFHISVIPLIHYVNFENKNIKILQNIIDIEKSSVRWKTKTKKEYDTFIKTKINSNKVLQKFVDEKIKLFNSDVVISNFIFYSNTISEIILKNYNDIQNILDSKIIPKEFIEDIITFSSFNLNIEKYNGLNTIHLINLNILCLTSKNLYLTPDARKNAILFLMNNLEIIKINCIQNKINLEIFLNKLFQLYNNLEKINNETDILYREKYTIRNNIISILNYLFINKNKSNNLFLSFYSIKLKNIINDNKKIKNMLCLLLIDFKSILENYFIIFTKVNNFDEEIKNGNLKQKLKLEDILFKNMSNLHLYDNFINLNFTFLESFINLFYSLFNSEIFIEKFADSINLFFKQFFNLRKKRADYFELKVNTIHHIKLIHSILNILKNNQVFINSIIENERLFKFDYFEYIQNFIENESKNNLKLQHISFKEFIQKLNKHIEIKPDIEKFKEDIPSKFCDPIMMTPLVEPYLLPESKLFIEKKNIISHLCINHTDPFNRSKLTIKDLQKYNEKPEVRDKINNLMQEFKKWKNENRI